MHASSEGLKFKFWFLGLESGLSSYISCEILSSAAIATAADPWTMPHDEQNLWELALGLQEPVPWGLGAS